MTTTTAATKQNQKILYIIRHGQAQHNPRAEEARANGCSMEEFFELMRQDDVIDSPLTELGKQQGKSITLFPRNENEESTATATTTTSTTTTTKVDLIVSSPLSRALETADLAYPPPSPPPTDGAAAVAAAVAEAPLRVCYEAFREVNGELLNGKRRTKEEIIQDFPHWNMDAIHENEDTSWSTTMEKFEDVAERGYQGLSWLLKERSEETILLVSHGGLLRYMMTIHPLVSLQDNRRRHDINNDNGDDINNDNGDDNNNDNSTLKPVDSRFDNCEVRKYALEWQTEETTDSQDADRRKIVLTQLDL